MASAIDEIATLADHLHVVAWLCRKTRFDVSSWYLEESHRHRWREPMRALQLYLQVREAERER